MSDPLMSLPSTVDAPLVVGGEVSATSCRLRGEVERLTERLFGRIVAIRERCDPEIAGENCLEFRVVEDNVDEALRKHDQWLQELLRLGGQSANRFHLSVVVRDDRG